jgi:hypothetical protein
MSDLSPQEIEILHEALDDEYLAWSTYDQVIEDFGEISPFINIREAESRHIEALCTLFNRYGVPVPPNPWLGRVERYKSIQEACEAGVKAEIANGEMYERLMVATQRRDFLEVLGNLQEASQKRHLRAFERCVSRRGSGCVAGRGRGRGNGGRC